MKMDLSIESMQDAVLGRAAIDGYLSVYSRTTRATKDPDPAVDIGGIGATEAAVTILPSTLQYLPQNDAPPGSAAPVIQDPTDPEIEGESFTKDQIKQAAAKDPALAALVGKKGRKSATEKTEIIHRTARALGVAVPAGTEQPVGAALAGATAADLQAALAKSTTLVHSEPGIEVRTAIVGPGTAIGGGTAGSPPAADSSLAALLAAKKTAEVPAAAVPTTMLPIAATTTLAPTPPLADPAAPGGQKPLEAMTNEELFAALRNYADHGGGLFWFRTVVERGGGDANKFTPEFMRQVLASPESFYPSAAA